MDVGKAVDAYEYVGEDGIGGNALGLGDGALLGWAMMKPGSVCLFTDLLEGKKIRCLWRNGRQEDAVRIYRIVHEPT